MLAKDRERGLVLAIGAFDGFHKGHQQLFAKAKAIAQKKGLHWSVLTFSVHPQTVLAKGPFQLLFTEQERLILAEFLGIPEMIKIPFSRTYADLDPVDFLDLLSSKVPVKGIVVGENFRFGRSRLGTPSLLTEEGQKRGWEVDIVPPFKDEGGTVVSSSVIRDHIMGGDVRTAEKLLGYPYFLRGTVVKGDQRGRQLGFPTANIAVKAMKLLPSRGVYAASAFCCGHQYPAAVNIGYNPTFEGKRSLRVEAHLLGFEEDIYGKLLSVFFIERLRGEIRFGSVEELKAQMRIDCERSVAAYYESLRRDPALWSSFDALLTERHEPSVRIHSLDLAYVDDLR